jgi:cobalt/nickel transport system permease protein
MKREIPSFLLKSEQQSPIIRKERVKLRMTFIDRTLKKMASFVRSSVIQYESSSSNFFQRKVSAQTILIFFLSYIICIGLAHEIVSQIIFTGALLILVLSSSVRPWIIYRNALILSFLFGFLVMIPAAINIFTPGRLLFTLIKFSSDKSIFIYHIPAVIGITYEGILLVARMYLKIFNSLSLTFLILYILPFFRLVKALRIIRVPGIFVLTVTLSYKFIYIMTYKQNETRNIIAGRVGFLFRKSWMRYEETYRAMIAKGFTGEITLTGIEKMTFAEICILCLVISAGIAIVKLAG